MSNLLLESGFKQEEIDHYNELKSAGFNDEEIVDYDRKTSMGYTDEQIANETRANRMMDSVVSGNALVDDLIAPETRVSFEKLVRYSNESDEFRDTMSMLMYTSLLTGIDPTQMEPMLDTVNENVLGLPARPHEAWQTIVKAYEDGYKRRYGSEIKKVPGPKLEAIQGTFADGYPVSYSPLMFSNVEYDYTTQKLEHIPLHIGKTLFEVPKAAVRFLEQDVFGTANTLGWWMGQIVEYGGVAVEKMGRFGTKNPDQIYNPLAEALTSWAHSIKANTEEGRAAWEYASMTGWEAMDGDLKNRDPISYAVGRISQSSMSSGLAVLAAWLGGPAAGVEMLDATARVNRGLVLLSGISAAGAFEHAKAQGENFFWSTIHALSDGMVEYYTESYFLKDVGPGASAFQMGKQEAKEEILAEMLQGTRAHALENVNKGMTTYDAVKKAVLQTLPQVPWAVVGGFIGGFGMGGGVNLVESVNKWVKMGEAMALSPEDKSRFLKMGEQRYQQLDEKRRAAGEIPTLGQKVLKQSEALTDDEIKELNFLEKNRGDIVAMYNHYQKPEESQFIRNVRRQMGGIRPISEAVEKPTGLPTLEQAEIQARTERVKQLFKQGPEYTKFAAKERDFAEKIKSGVLTVEEAAKVLDEYATELGLPEGQAKPNTGIVAAAPGAKDELARLQDRSRELTRKTYFLTAKEQEELDKIDEQIETLLTEREAAAPKFGIRAAAPGGKYSIEAVRSRRDDIMESGKPKVINALQAIEEYYTQENLESSELGKRVRYIADRYNVDTSEVFARLYCAAMERLSVPSGATYVKMTSSMKVIDKANITDDITREAESLDIDPAELAKRRLYAQLLLLGTKSFNFTPLNDVLEGLRQETEKPGGITGMPKKGRKVLSLDELAEEIAEGEILVTNKDLPLPLRSMVSLSYERMAEVGMGHWPFVGARKLTGALADKPRHMAEDMLFSLLTNKKGFSFNYQGQWIEVPASPLTEQQIEEIEELQRQADQMNVEPFSYVWKNFLKQWEHDITYDKAGNRVVKSSPLEFLWDSSLKILNEAAMRSWEIKNKVELRRNPSLRRYAGTKKISGRNLPWLAQVKLPGEQDKHLGSFRTRKEAIEARRKFFIDRFGTDYQGYNINAMPSILAYPGYKDEVTIQKSVKITPKMYTYPSTMELTEAEDLLIERHKGAAYTGKNTGVVFKPGEYPPNPVEAEIIENIGAEVYNEKYGKNFKIVGQTFYDGSTGRLISEIFSEGTGRARVLAEELYHPVFYIIRERDRGSFGKIQEWFDRRTKFAGQTIEEAFSKELSLIEIGARQPSRSDLPTDIINLARDIFSGKQSVSQEVMDKVKAEFTTERFSIEEEGGLILPEDIHRGEEGFRPKGKKIPGFTAAELKLFGKDFAGIVRWAQLHDEPVGYKQGVGDSIETSRRAIDALRTREEIRQRNRIDAANLVFTYIPKEFRGDFVRRLMKIKTTKQIQEFADVIESWVDAHEQRELIKEFKRFKGKVRRETKRGEVPFGQLPAHIAEQIDELLNKFDPVALSKQKAESLQSRHEWYSRMTALLADGYDAITAEFDDDARSFFVIPRSDIEELRRLSQAPIKDVTPDEIRWTIDQVTRLLELHQAKGDSRFRRRWENLHPKINTAWHQVYKQVPGPEYTGAAGLFKRAATIGQSNMRTLINYATGKENDAVTELLFDAVVKGNNQRIVKYKEFVQAWQKELDKAKIKWGDVSKTFEELVKIKIGRREIELTRDDLLMLYGYTVADGTMRRLLKTEGLNITTYRPKGLFMTAQTYRVGRPTLEELRAISALILPVHKKLLDIHFKINREIQLPAINEISMELQNTEIARDKNYLSVHREARKNFSGFKAEEMAAAIEMLGRYKPRTGGTLRMNIRGFTREIMTGLQSDAFYYGMTIPMMEARSLLMNKSFVGAMKDNGHSAILDYIGTLYDRMQLYGNDQALLDQAFTTLFSQVGKSMLSLRWTGGAIQIATIPAAYGVIPSQYFKITIPSRKQVNDLMEKYPSLWLRWKAKHFDFALGTLAAQHAFENMIFEKTPTTDKLLEHYTWGDQAAIYNIYKGAETMMDAVSGLEKGSPGYEIALQRLFDRAMETQGMYDALHRSIVTTDTAFFARGFTWFMCSVNAQLNVVQQAFDDANKGRITEAERNKRLANIAMANFYVSFIRNVLRTGLQAVGIAFFTALGLREPPDEEEAKEILKRLAYKLPFETVFNIVGMNVVGNVLSAAAYNGMRAAKYKWSGYDVRYLRTGNLGVDLFTDMVTMGAEGWEFATDLITLEKTKGTKYKPGEYAFMDSGERFMRSVLLMTAYRLGLPFEGPMSDLYYPLKRAYQTD